MYSNIHILNFLLTYNISSLIMNIDLDSRSNEDLTTEWKSKRSDNITSKIKCQ